MIEATSTTFDCVLRAWQAHEKALLAFLILRTGGRHAAEDLLQEVFLKSMREGRRFCAVENPRAWLFRVARNALIDTARSAKPGVAVPDDLAAPPTTSRAPVEELDACLARNLRELGAQDQRIIEACDLNGQTVPAFADTQGLSLAAAKSRLLRARQRLRDTLVRNCQVRFDEAGKVCCYVPRNMG